MMEWTDDRVSRFWAHEAKHPENYFTNHSGHAIARKLRPFLKDHKRVLDYGCGLGFFVPHLARLGLEVTATDHSIEAIEATNERNANVPGFQGAHFVNALTGTFDAIVSIEVIEHLTDDQLDGYLDTMWRLLEPGGTAIVTTPNAENLSASEVYCPCCENTFHRWQHVRSWNIETLGGELVRQGFKPWTAFATDFGASRRDAPSRALWRALGKPVSAPHLVHVVTR